MTNPSHALASKLQKPSCRKANDPAFTTRWLALLAPLLLAACATTSSPDTPTDKPAASTRSSSASKSPTASTKRGGGYYKDDGPDESPPENLNSIPDAQPKNEAIIPASTRPYLALGQSYTPMKTRKPFTQSGIASWYGKKFHGAKTSSGEPYDMYAMTAAHPTLPLPSYVRVTNLDNGRSVIVRVNDRGPFHSNRIIDLSYTAAWKLGYINKGSTRVEIETILPDENGNSPIMLAASTPPSTPSPSVPPPSSRIVTRPSAQQTAPPPVSSPEKVASNDDAITPAQALAEAFPEIETADPANQSGKPSGSQLSPASPALLTTIGATETRTSAATPTVTTDTSAASIHGIFLQLGSFSSDRNAESFREYVKTELKWLDESLSIFNEQGSFRLHLGPFDNVQTARATADRITQSIKLKPFVIQR